MLRGRDAHRSPEVGRHRMTFFALTAAAAVALAAAAVAAAAIDGSGPDDPAPYRSAPVTTVEPDLAAGFAVFARARRASDVMSAAARAQLAGPARNGFNPALSRAIATPSGTGWAVPGRSTVCIVMPDPVDGFGVVCSPTSSALRAGLVGIMISPRTPDTAALSVLLPREATATATLADGHRRSLEADDDGVVNTQITGARSIAIKTPSGLEHVPMPLPPPAAPTQRDCGQGRIVGAHEACP